MKFSRSSSSLILPSSLSPKSSSLVLSKPTTKSSPSLLSVSLKTPTPTPTPTPTTKSFSISFERSYNNKSVASRFIRNFSRRWEFNQKVSSSGTTDEEFALFVGNISFYVDSAQLAGLFERAGDVEMVEVIHDKNTGKSRGFAFVTMSTVEEAKAAAQMFDGYALDGRPIKVNYGPPARRAMEVNYGPPSPKDKFSSRATRDCSTRCYVGNLSWDVDAEALETLFNQQGKVLEARIVYNRESGESRGFGFVTYGSSEEVQNAISFLNGVDLNGREIRVMVSQRRI